MPQVINNFTYNAAKPLDARDLFSTLDDMNNVNPKYFDDGHISYCKETSKHYVFTADIDDTGTKKVKWTEFTGNQAAAEATGIEVFDTVNNIKTDAEAKEGKLVYCKEDSNYYTYTGTEWKVFKGNNETSEIDENTKSDIQKLMNKVFPMSYTFSINNTTGNIYAAFNTTVNPVISMSVSKADQDITHKVTADLNIDGKTFTSVPGSVMLSDVSSDKIITASGTISYKNEVCTVNNSQKIIFTGPSYSGIVDESFTVTDDTIKTLIDSNKLSVLMQLCTGRNITYIFPASYGCHLYMYPAKFGVITAAKDTNNFDYKNSYIKTDITYNNQKYYVYKLKNAASVDAGYKITFS